jgi:hypothetical protein
MSGTRVFEARRYSAVLINDPDLPDVASVMRSLRVPKSRSTPIDIAVTDWTVARASIIGDTPHYPAANAHRTESGAYLTELYVAAPTDSASSGVLLASPYVRLLATCLRDMASSVRRDVVFVKPDMDALFTHFERTRTPHLSATRISVLMEGDVGLEVVSLSGRNPLRSDLRHALLKVASPYSIRIKGTYLDSRGTNMHADRHGNVWWYLSSEAALVNVLAMINVVRHGGMLSQTTSSPLKRAFQEDEN